MVVPDSCDGSMPSMPNSCVSVGSCCPLAAAWLECLCCCCCCTPSSVSSYIDSGASCRAKRASWTHQVVGEGEHCCCFRPAAVATDLHGSLGQRSELLHLVLACMFLLFQCLSSPLLLKRGVCVCCSILCSTPAHVDACLCLPLMTVDAIDGSVMRLINAATTSKFWQDLNHQSHQGFSSCGNAMCPQHRPCMQLLTESITNKTIQRYSCTNTTDIVLATG